jgi:DNA-binding IclR family transcriptional regulator
VTLTERQMVLLDALGKDPLTPQRLAQMVGAPSGRWIGRNLSRLQEAGLAQRTDDGLWKRKART